MSQQDFIDSIHYLADLYLLKICQE